MNTEVRALVRAALGRSALYGQGWDDAQYEAAADALIAALNKAGWAVVPREPDENMLLAGRDAARKVQRVGVSGMTIEAQIKAECIKELATYRAMIAAGEARDE